MNNYKVIESPYKPIQIGYGRGGTQVVYRVPRDIRVVFLDYNCIVMFATITYNNKEYTVSRYISPGMSRISSWQSVENIQPLSMRWDNSYNVKY